MSLTEIPRRRGFRFHIPRSVTIGLGTLVFCLIVIGQGMALVNAYRSGATQSIPIPRTGTLRHRMTVALSAALGPSDRGVRRFRIDSIVPDANDHTRKDVTVTWAINSDLTWGTLGNGAQVDVYIILRTLYDDGFPVALVNLTGTYPTHTRRESVVMRLAMSRRIDRVLKEAGGWNEYDAGAVWPLIHHIWVNPDFQPQSEE